MTYVETQFEVFSPLKDFQDFLQHKRIISQRSCPYTPEQNDVMKHKNRHLLVVVQTLLLESFVP